MEIESVHRPSSLSLISYLQLTLPTIVSTARTKEITEEVVEYFLWYSTKKIPKVLNMPTVMKYSTVLPFKKNFKTHLKIDIFSFFLRRKNVMNTS